MLVRISFRCFVKFTILNRCGKAKCLICEKSSRTLEFNKTKSKHIHATTVKPTMLWNRLTTNNRYTLHINHIGKKCKNHQTNSSHMSHKHINNLLHKVQSVDSIRFDSIRRAFSATRFKLFEISTTKKTKQKPFVIFN